MFSTPAGNNEKRTIQYSLTIPKRVALEARLVRHERGERAHVEHEALDDRARELAARGGRLEADEQRGRARVRERRLEAPERGHVRAAAAAHRHALQQRVELVERVEQTYSAQHSIAQHKQLNCVLILKIMRYYTKRYEVHFKGKRKQ